jgi:CheY-like chemotaxis protein
MDVTILLVDDDPILRTLIHRVLTRVGYQVQEAADGLAALEQITALRPALVLTDLMMPRMNGDALIAQVRQRPDPIPCILMSAFRPDVPPEQVPFLAKPFAMADLVRLVSETLPQPSAGTRTTGMSNRSPRSRDVVARVSRAA